MLISWFSVPIQRLRSNGRDNNPNLQEFVVFDSNAEAGRPLNLSGEWRKQDV